MKLHGIHFFVAWAMLVAINAKAESNRIDSLKQVLKTASATQKAQTLSNLCWEYRNESVDSAIVYGQKAVLFSRKEKLQPQLAQALNDLGIIYNDMASFEIAIPLYVESFTIRKLLKDSMGMASLYLKMGIVYQKMGNLKRALENQLASLDLYEKLNYNKGIAYCQNNIAVIHYYMGNLNKSLEYHSMSLNLKSQMGDEYGEAGSLVNIGNIYSDQKKYEKAIENFRKALALVRKIGDKEYLSATLNNLGSVLIKNNNASEALPLLLEALNLRKQEADKKGLLSTYINLANAYRNLNQNNKVQVALEEALALSKQVNALAEQIALYKNLAEEFEKKGNYPKALLYYKTHNTLEDSLLNMNLNQQVAEMQTKFETEKKEKENEILKNDITQKELQLSTHTHTQNILIILLLFTLIIAFSAFLIIRIRNKAQLNQALLQQEKIRLREILKVQEEERKRISQELHDGVGQMMALVKMRVSDMEPQANQRESYKSTLHLIDSSCNELRQISHQLMPGILIKGGLSDAVQELTTYFTQTNNLKIFTNITNFERRYSELIEINLFRIIQELLNNIIKHARATEIHIQLSSDENMISLMVEDNGVGMSKESITKGKGNGWLNIYSRLEMIKGTVEIDTKPQKGTVVFIEVEEQELLK